MHTDTCVYHAHGGTWSTHTADRHKVLIHPCIHCKSRNTCTQTCMHHTHRYTCISQAYTLQQHNSPRHTYACHIMHSQAPHMHHAHVYKCSRQRDLYHTDAYTHVLHRCTSMYTHTLAHIIHWHIGMHINHVHTEACIHTWCIYGHTVQISYSDTWAPHKDTCTLTSNTHRHITNMCVTHQTCIHMYIHRSTHVHHTDTHISWVIIGEIDWKTQKCSPSASSAIS